MNGGYESLVWLNDEDGREYVCSLEEVGSRRDGPYLTDEEKNSCMDVNLLIGTERW